MKLIVASDFSARTRKFTFVVDDKEMEDALSTPNREILAKYKDNEMLQTLVMLMALWAAHHGEDLVEFEETVDRNLPFMAGRFGP